MAPIDPTIRTPSTPFVTPRAPGYREEKRRHEDNPHHSDENSESEDSNLEQSQGEHPRDNENKGTKIDIQI